MHRPTVATTLLLATAALGLTACQLFLTPTEKLKAKVSRKSDILADWTDTKGYKFLLVRDRAGEDRTLRHYEIRKYPYTELELIGRVDAEKGECIAITRGDASGFKRRPGGTYRYERANRQHQRRTDCSEFRDTPAWPFVQETIAHPSAPRVPKSLWVVASTARLCPSRTAEATPGAGGQNTPAPRRRCKGGVGLDKGAQVSVHARIDEETYEVTPQATTSDLRVRGTMRASDLAATPDLDDQQAFYDAAKQRAGKRRFPSELLDFTSLTESVGQLRRFQLVTTLDVNRLIDMRVRGREAIFVTTVPSSASDSKPAPVVFRFANAAWARRYQKGLTTYSCGQAHCDRLVVVARLRPRPMDFTDTSGRVWRTPVFEIERLADRYRAYGRGASR